jgi:hypothetical protein
VPGCGVAVRSGVVGMVRSTGVLSDDGVVAMGTIGVTTLHPRGPGRPELPPPPEAVSPLLYDSSRMMCRDGDPLCTIPMNTMPESFPSGERLGLPKRSTVNFKLSKQMVLPRRIQHRSGCCHWW